MFILNIGENNMNKEKNFLIDNLKLIIPIIIFMIISILTIYSSQKLLSSAYNNLYIKQLIWYLISFLFLIIIIKSKRNIFYEYAHIFYIFGNILLLLVLLFGTESNGAKCWFTIPKLGSFQPSEFVKIFLILMLAKELDKSKIIKSNFKDELKIMIKCFVITLIPSILTFLEPDTGIIFIYFIILITMLFVYGIRYRWFIGAGLIISIILTIFLYIFLKEQDLFISIFGNNFFYRMDRLLGWKNGDGMQLTHAMAATGSAGLFGYGFSKTPIYFPEPQTDFIFSVFASNFGFIPTLILILLMVYFDIQIIKLALNSDSKDKYIYSGILAMLLFQQIQNIAMNIGLLPITGITLPFISYGGSSLVSYMITIGILINTKRNAQHN